VGAHFGVVLVANTCDAANDIHADAAALAPPQVVTEVATFRSDGVYLDGRHPDAVRYTLSAEEDVRRRDFTINSLLLDTERFFPQGLKPGALADRNVRAEARTLHITDRDLHDAVIDHVGGMADLDAGILRAIGEPAARFEEDHLRMLRAVRFAARFGFQIEAATAAAIRRLAPKIKAGDQGRDSTPGGAH